MRNDARVLVLPALFSCNDDDILRRLGRLELCAPGEHWQCAQQDCSAGVLRALRVRTALLVPD